MTHINFVWMIDFDDFPWAVSDMIRRSVGSVEALPGGTSSPSIYLGHKWARSKAFKAYLTHVELIRYA